ncbi:hypothetical protein [Parvibaculum sp.]|uniref:hypothetical protein n=1 Tax=Parvibaculum sp. TaxID=2024848 RepID=UPI003BABA335
MSAEGDFVTAGQVLAWMDDAQVKAEIAAATADVRQAEQQKAQTDAPSSPSARQNSTSPSVNSAAPNS